MTAAPSAEARTPCPRRSPAVAEPRPAGRSPAGGAVPRCRPPPGSADRGHVSPGALDLRDDAVGVAEELVVDLVPAAQVGDRGQLARPSGTGCSGRSRPGPCPASTPCVGRPPALAREQLLSGRALGVGQEVLRARRGGLGDSRGRLDEERLLRDDVVELLAGLARGDRFALVRDQRVAGAGKDVTGGGLFAGGCAFSGLVIRLVTTRSLRDRDAWGAQARIEGYA